jgi:putative transposase
VDALSATGDAHMRALARWLLNLRHIDEMMKERGMFLDHTTVHRWTIKILPVLSAVFRRRKRTVVESWRMDENCVKVTGG